MNNGFVAEPSTDGGETVWKLVDASNRQVLAKGNTVLEAVKQYEEKEGEASWAESP